MNDFKEWLSDYLRYFLLLLAVLIFFLLILLGIRIVRGSKQEDAGNQNDKNAIQILTEQETEETEAIEKQQTETVKKETESETAKESEKTIKESEQTKTKDTAAKTDATQQTKAGSGTPSAVQTESTGSESTTATGQETTAQSETSQSETAAPKIEPETQPVTETEHVPVYKTLKGSCYIRSAPSYEGEIIGEYMYGTTVEFLEDVGGWYKVQIDGMVGYMGARFF